MATNTCPTVKLPSGYEMPMVALGTFNNLKEEGVTEAVIAAIDYGYRAFDCGYIYRSEGAVGRGIADRIKAGVVKREDLFITTKLWNTFHEPEQVEPGIKESLQDLGLDYLDLFLMHWPMAFTEPETDKKGWILNPDIVPSDVHFVDTWKAMESLVGKGLTRSIGICSFNIQQVETLFNSSLSIKPAYIQLESHPLLVNQELIDYCKSRGMVVTVFSPLAKGGALYAGKPTENVMKDDRIVSIAKNHNKTPAQVVLRWSIQRGVALVVKSVTPARIRENFQLFDFTLSDSEMKTISSMNKNRRLVTLEVYKDFPEFPFKL